MNYKIKLTESVAEIQHDLPRNIYVRLLQRLINDVATDPDKWLVQNVVPFADKFSLSLTIDDHQSHPHQWWFVLVVDRGTPGVLLVEHIRFATNPETN